MATFHLEVVTPDKSLVKEEVEMAICPGTEGEFGILPNHISLLAALRIGALRYRKDGKDYTLFIGGGFVDMHNNKCSVLAESAERTEDIDLARAEEARKRAEIRLNEKKSDVDEIRARIALKKAILRLQLGGRA